MNLVKKLSTQLQKEGVKVKVLKHPKFVSELSKFRDSSMVNAEEHNGFYIYEKDLVLVNEESKYDQDYLLCHELIHSIRTNENRLGYRFTMPEVHSTMKKVLRQSYGSAYLPIYLNQATQDIAYWREEAICDVIALFFCINYLKKDRESMDIGRFTFIPLAFKDVYTEKDKKSFLKMIKNEAFEVIFYMSKYDNFLPESQILTSQKFDSFFDSEVEFTMKKIADKFNKK